MDAPNKPKFDAFLSHNSLDKPAVETIARRLETEAELKVWLDKWDSVPGEDAIEELETAIGQSRACVVFLGPSGVGPWHKEEKQAALRKRVRDKSYRVIPVLLPEATKPTDNDLPSFLLNLGWVDFSANGLQDPEEFHRLVCGIKGISPRQAPLPTPTTSESQCPYRGLEVFEEEHAHLFFGRDNFIAAIEQKLNERQFIAVVGPSGSGKSSVVQAGVFPRLGGEWHKLVFQPGDNPFLNLADKFVEMRGTKFRHFSERSKAVEAVAQQIRDNCSIGATVAEVLTTPSQFKRLLLVADQFEELFTLTPVVDRQPFVEALLAAAHLAELKVLATLRADFYGQAISLTSELSQWLQDGVVNHRPLQRIDWEAVILNPAKTAGLHVDPALVTLILEDIESQPDSLPLLEYALKELWQQRTQNRIGITEYAAIGKLAGAINQRADTVLAQLSEEEQTLALRAMTRLVRVSGGEDEGADTRLRLPLNELTDEQRDVLMKLTAPDARLLVTNRHDRSGEETIEVAHEALIRRWEKLREELDRNREFLVWRRRLNVRRSLWDQKGRDNKWLLSGGELEEAQRWLDDRNDELSQTETEFITWADRPEFQIERILAKAPDILPFCGSDNDGEENPLQNLQEWFVSLIFCGEREKAFSSARNLEDANGRASALSFIAEALANVGMTSEALAATHEIKNVEARSYALSFIAEALANVGMNSEGYKVLAEALAAAREIEDALARSNALSYIAGELANEGMTSEANNVMQEALAAAREIENDFGRSNALNSVAEVLANAGMTSEGHKVMQEALAAAREIKSAYARSNALNSVVGALANVGMISEALPAAREIEEEHARSNALSSIAGALANAGMTSEALAAAREIKSAYARSNALSLIAEALANVGMTSEANKVMQEVLAAVRENEDAYARSNALRSMSVVWVNAGMTSEVLAAAHEIENVHTRSNALSSIAQTLVKAGLTTDALAAAREVENARTRSDALSYIAGELANAGMTSEANEVMEKALSAAREIEDASSRASALTTIANFWLGQGQIVEVESVLKELQDAANKVYNSYERSSSERELAVILARLHHYREARRYADRCDYKDRLAAYTAILREYHIERNPSLALLFAEENN